MVQSLLVLYCTQFLHLSDHQAYLLYATFSTLLFTMPVIGGYIGAHWLGQTAAALFGMLLASAGLYCFCFNQLVHLYLGLALFSVGTGVAIANLFILLEKFYSTATLSSREKGFALWYTAMNFGAFFALIVSGFLVNGFGFQSVFLISAIFMLIAILCFLSASHRFAPRSMIHPNATPKKTESLMGCCALLLCIPFTSNVLFYSTHNAWSLLFFSALLLVLMLILVNRLKEKIEADVLRLFLLLNVLGICFWSPCLLGPSVLTLSIQHKHLLNPSSTPLLYQHVFFHFGCIAITVGLIACLLAKLGATRLGDVFSNHSG